MTALPLSMADPYVPLRIVAIRGGFRRHRKRMADLGLNIGMTISVVSPNIHGPLILEVKDSRLAIGRGMAHHILVEPL